MKTAFDICMQLKNVLMMLAREIKTKEKYSLPVDPKATLFHAKKKTNVYAAQSCSLPRKYVKLLQ